MPDVSILNAGGKDYNIKDKLAREGLNLSLPPNNEIIYDNAGRPSVMVKVPKMSYYDLGLGSFGSGTFPAWRVNGKEVPYIYISKYQNVIVEDKAYSLPMKMPATFTNFDRAIQVCESKGDGWHLMSNVEWQAIALWCAKHDCMPYGNNDSGCDYYHGYDKGVIEPYRDYYDDGPNDYDEYYFTLTGSGPKDWFHNNDFSGIADLNGNVWEWVGGIRINSGEFNIIKDNDTVTHVDQGASSSQWKAILPGTSKSNTSLVTPGTNGTLITTSKGLGIKGKDTAGNSYGSFYNRTADKACSTNLTVVPQEAYAHGLLCHGIETERCDYTYFYNTGEHMFYRGGGYDSTDSAGVFCMLGNSLRSYSIYNLGFRSAYVPPELWK